MTFIWGRYNTGHARGPTRCSRVYMVRGIKLVLLHGKQELSLLAALWLLTLNL